MSKVQIQWGKVRLEKRHEKPNPNPTGFQKTSPKVEISQNVFQKDVWGFIPYILQCGVKKPICCSKVTSCTECIDKT